MPSVSIIIPCYNELDTIRKLLEAVYAQTFPHTDLEMVIADGMSTDGTRAEIAAFSDAHPDLHIAMADNPAQSIPSALNCALKEAQGEIIVRLDAHSVPYPDYIERCVAGLPAGKRGRRLGDPPRRANLGGAIHRCGCISSAGRRGCPLPPHQQGLPGGYRPIWGLQA